jgi:hypothetical protein
LLYTTLNNGFEEGSRMQAILRTRTLIATALLSIVMGSTFAAAADRVTLVLRSGEKITGDLDGQTENRIYVRTSHADQPKVPIDQIAMIDVGGDAINPSAEEVAQATGSAHYLIPQNGAPFKGQFIRLEGSLGEAEAKAPVIVFKKESGEEARIAVSATRRLYLGNYTPPSTQSTAATTGSTAAPLAAGERLVTVMANADWVDTGLTVRQGQVVSFTSSGEITLSADQNDKATTGGSFNGRKAAGAPIPTANAGALVGRVSNARGRGASAVVAIGDQKSVAMPAAGRLFLRVNDDHVGDNSGQFEVRLKLDSPGSN